MVVPAAERGDHGLDVDVALAERAEHAALERRLEALVVRSEPGDDGRPAVLDVDVPDEVAVVDDRPRRVGPAEPEVAGVEAQADERRIHPVHDPGDLVGRLDVRPGVRMEDRLEPLLAADLGGAMEVVDERLEPLGRQPGLGVVRDPARPAQPIRLVEVVGQDGERLRAGGRAVPHELEVGAQPGAVGVGLLGPAEVLRQERPDEGETARRQALAELGGIAEVAGRAELRPFVPDVDHPVEHVVGRRHPGVVRHDLVDTERDRGARDTHGWAGHGTSVMRVDQGLMTILTASPERIRAMPAAVSSSAMMAVIIGARSSWPLSTSRMAAGKVKFEM